MDRVSIIVGVNKARVGCIEHIEPHPLLLEIIMSKNENENCRIFAIFAIACISGYKCIILDFHQQPFF